ncbi:MAG: 30S ribosomal protein S8 [Verrucomicrobia bacterium]|nr:30S ribosomal protein S8 [Verrucomicrobiota bacterium]MBS0635940.1 30S ribosomal protein S8 [Verrucomicrobiota bacterium]
MSFNDPVSDLLTRIRNASMARHRFVDVQWSVLSQNIAQLLKDESFIEHFLVKNEGGKSHMRIFLRYNTKREPLIRGLTRVSKPGRRRYVGYNDIPRVFNGLGISIVSTSKGVLVGSNARHQKVGGELLCQVW